MNALTKRLQFWKSIRAHWGFRALAVVWFLIGAWATVRDNFLSPRLEQKLAEPAVLSIVPWYFWAIGFLAFVTVMIFEGAFHAYDRKLGTACTDDVSDQATAAPMERASAASGVSINISPTISSSISNANTPSTPSPSDPASTPKEKPKPRRPNLVLLNAVDIPIAFSKSISGGEVFTEGRGKDQPLGIVAYFRNELSDSVQVKDAYDVRAHVIYRNADEQEIGTGIESVCWLDHHPDSINFRLGQSHGAFLGYWQRVDELRVPWKERKRYWEGDAIYLNEKKFKGVSSIEVNLIDGNNNLLLGPTIFEIGFVDGDYRILYKREKH